MLDHHLFSRGVAAVEMQLRSRGVATETVAALGEATAQRRAAIQQVEGQRQTLNTATAQVQVQAQAGNHDGVAAARLALRQLKAEIKQGEEALQGYEATLQDLLLTVPNLPQASVPLGNSEADNRLERTWGEPQPLGFPAQAHWDLVERLGLVSFEQGAKMSGARFAVMRGLGARLERGLAHLMLDMAQAHGYTEVAPPLLVRPEAMQAAGQYPKFIGESFETLEREYVLVPTSEVALINLHRDEILAAEALPLRYAAYTPCFRREAGAAGRDTRGLIRQHQFNKVELVALTTPEASEAELERLTGHAEAVLQRLQLPYRCLSLCTGDMGFTAAKTYDLEVWLPGQAAYREISSCSNCEDFQARRAQIRYRIAGDPRAKPRLVHTLNGSGLAVGRTLVAVVENGQREDGSLTLPAALVPYVGFRALTAAGEAVV